VKPFINELWREKLKELASKKAALSKFLNEHQRKSDQEPAAAHNLERYYTLSEKENRCPFKEGQDTLQAKRAKLIREEMDSSTPFEREIILFLLKRTDKPDILIELAMKLKTNDLERFQEIYQCLTEKDESSHSSDMSYIIEQVKMWLLVSTIKTPIERSAFLFALKNESNQTFILWIKSIAREKEVRIEESL